MTTGTIRYLMVTALLAVCVGGAVAQAKLEVSNETIDLGVLYNGQKVRTELSLKNAGNQPLQILGVRTSCGCTTVRKPKDLLKPGDSDVVEVEFNSTGFRGTYTKYVYIESSDPASPYTTVTLKAEVREELTSAPKPSIVWLGSIAVQSSGRTSIPLRNISDHPIQLRKITGLPKDVSVTYDKKLIQPSDSVRLTVNVTAKREGYATVLFHVQTDSNNQPEVPLRVSYMGVKPE